MSAYDLPTSLTIGEVAFPINYGWKNAIEILCAFCDTEKTQAERVAYMLTRLIPNWRQLSPDLIPEAIQKACDFLDCGKQPENTRKPKLVDWAQDADLIIPAVNQAANREVRADPNIHWWTFCAWYMNVDGGLFSTVVRIRKKLAYGESLEKWERKFLRENGNLVALKSVETDAVKKEKDDIRRWMQGGG